MKHIGYCRKQSQRFRAQSRSSPKNSEGKKKDEAKVLIREREYSV